MNSAQTQDTIGASVTRGSTVMNKAEAHGVYSAKCYDSKGVLKWEEEFDNLVTTEGKNFLLDSVLTGITLAANMFSRMAFVSSNTNPLVAMTYASPSYTETTPGVISTRGTPIWGASSAGTKSSSAVAASILGTDTIYGVAIVVLNAASIGNLNSSGDTSTANAKLYSYGLFSSGKAVTNGDTLNVSYSTTLT